MARRALAAVAAFVASLGVAVLIGSAFRGPTPVAVPRTALLDGADATKQAPPANRPPDDAPARESGRGAVAWAARSGIRRARSIAAGDYEAVVWLDGWRRPVVAAAGFAPGGRTPRRAWSLSKLIAAVTVLRLRRAAGLSLTDRTTNGLLVGALARSENCAARRLVLSAQDLAGGAEPGREQLAATAALAGARLAVPPAAPPELDCTHRLPVQDRARDIVLLGTSVWTALDAATFVRALAHGAFPKGVGAEVLRLMRLPKANSTEIAQPLRAPADWGAGQVFADRRWQVAYKAGWGGASSGHFEATQAMLVVDGAHPAVIVLSFRPQTPPRTDDPADSRTPQAFSAALTPIRDVLATTP